ERQRARRVVDVRLGLARVAHLLAVLVQEVVRVELAKGVDAQGARQALIFAYFLHRVRQSARWSLPTRWTSPDKPPSTRVLSRTERRVVVKLKRSVPARRPMGPSVDHFRNVAEERNSAIEGRQLVRTIGDVQIRDTSLGVTRRGTGNLPLSRPDGSSLDRPPGGKRLGAGRCVPGRGSSDEIDRHLLDLV